MYYKLIVSGDRCRMPKSCICVCVCVFFLTQVICFLVILFMSINYGTYKKRFFAKVRSTDNIVALSL